jgi:hypothetical protein
LSKPATARSGNVVKQRVIAPASEFARYRASGYVVEACDVPIEQLRQSVANVCRAAATTPAETQARIARSHGASLSGLCASGRAGLAEMDASSTQ